MGIALFAFGTSSCKKKKELAAKAAAEAALKSELKSALEALLADNTMSAAQMQDRLDKIKSQITFKDADLDKLVKQVEDKIEKLRAEETAKAEEARKKAEEEARLKAEREKFTAYDKQFEAIAKAPSAAAANSLITEYLNQFESKDTPLLIIVFEQGETKDYDKPTTIGKFLNYLKDHKKYENKTVNVTQNTQGKVNLIELKKQ